MIPERSGTKPVTLKIDAVLKTINEYRDLILKQEGISAEQWKSNPGTLLRPDAMNVAAIPLMKSNETLSGERLES